MRPLISYNDIASNPPTPTPSTLATRSSVNGKGILMKTERRGRVPPRHRDDPDQSTNSISYQGRHSSPANVGKKRKRQNDEWSWQSRKLTHEEIWDDSALVEAWDAAMEEYQILNGDKDSWKEELVHKSALWYNEPFIQSGPKEDMEERSEVGDDTMEDDQEENTQPFDFDTFVPTHDPALESLTGRKQTLHQASLPSNVLDMAVISKDDAFRHATQAWYWAGYWTAIYHSKADKTVDDVNLASEEFLDTQRAEEGEEAGDASQEEDEVIEGS